MRFHCQLLSIWSAWSRRVGVGRWWPAAAASRGDAVSPWCRWPSTVSPDPAGRGRPSLLTPAPHLNLVKNQTPIYEMNISSVGPSKSLMFRLNHQHQMKLKCVYFVGNKQKIVTICNSVPGNSFSLHCYYCLSWARRPQDCYVDSVQSRVGSNHSVTYHSRFYNEFTSLAHRFYISSRFILILRVIIMWIWYLTLSKDKHIFSTFLIVNLPHYNIWSVIRHIVKPVHITVEWSVSSLYGS